jgi:hypothetical protein
MPLSEGWEGAASRRIRKSEDLLELQIARPSRIWDGAIPIEDKNGIPGLDFQDPGFFFA